jgi:hypothetical protein
VDTAGVKPLQSIRDETEAGVKESAVSLASLELELDMEEVAGHSRRIRTRRDAPAPILEEMDWKRARAEGWKMGHINAFRRISSARKKFMKTVSPIGLSKLYTQSADLFLRLSMLQPQPPSGG